MVDKQGFGILFGQLKALLEAVLRGRLGKQSMVEAGDILRKLVKDSGELAPQELQRLVTGRAEFGNVMALKLQAVLKDAGPLDDAGTKIITSSLHPVGMDQIWGKSSLNVYRGPFFRADVVQRGRSAHILFAAHLEAGKLTVAHQISDAVDPAQMSTSLAGIFRKNWPDVRHVVVTSPLPATGNTKSRIQYAQIRGAQWASFGPGVDFNRNALRQSLDWELARNRYLEDNMDGSEAAYRAVQISTQRVVNMRAAIEKKSPIAWPSLKEFISCSEGRELFPEGEFHLEVLPTASSWTRP